MNKDHALYQPPYSDPDLLSIGPFTGRYRFLSNFAAGAICYNSINYPTVEHAYQAAKTTHRPDQLRISRLPTAAAAKRAGRQLIIKKDWMNIRLAIMESLLELKFAPGAPNHDLLLTTAPRILIEYNRWNDRFWGICHGRGHNHLGKLLIKTRHALQRAQSPVTNTRP